MEFSQVVVRVRRTDAERAEALLNLASPLALAFDDATDTPLFEPAPGEAPLWPELLIRALFAADFDAAALGRVLRTALPQIISLEVQRIDEKDWQAGLEQAVYVQRIADNLCVIPANWEDTPPAANPVQLNMGLAFGTGRHATTRLCLEWLANQPPRDCRVCDFGCGSGILAIASLILGAQHAIAIDIDPQAIAATRANAQLNGVAQRLIAGEAADFPNVTVDIVLANILAGTLNESLSAIAAMLRPGGTIVLSGVLAHQAEEVERQFAVKFASFNTEIRDGWARISAIMREC